MRWCGFRFARYLPGFLVCVLRLPQKVCYLSSVSSFSSNMLPLLMQGGTWGWLCAEALFVAAPFDMWGSGEAWSSRCAEMAARERLRVGRFRMLKCCERPSSRDIAVGAREWLPVGLYDLFERTVWRRPAHTTLGARERLRMGCRNLLCCCLWRTPRGTSMGARQWLQMGRASLSRCCFERGWLWDVAMASRERLPMGCACLECCGPIRTSGYVEVAACERLRVRFCFDCNVGLSGCAGVGGCAHARPPRFL